MRVRLDIKHLPRLAGGYRKLGKVEKQIAAEKWQATRQEYTAELVCNFRSFEAPHHLNAHEHLAGGKWGNDWRTWEDRRRD